MSTRVIGFWLILASLLAGCSSFGGPAQTERDTDAVKRAEDPYHTESGLIVPPPGIAEAAAVEPAATTDIPQRMMDALDKYRQIQQQRGGQVDLAP